MNHHEQYMQEALKLANKAFEHDEVPIGAIVVHNGEIIGRGYNQREHTHKIHNHAEILALNEAASYLKSWNLEGATLYVTVEPCPMCAGAILQTHTSMVVYGCKEPNSGSLGSVISLQNVELFNHSFDVIGGVLENEARELMRSFFKTKRNQQVNIKKATTHTFEEALKLRLQVFVKEQGVPLHEEIDEYDNLDRDDVQHIVAIHEGQVIGTARYIRNKDEYKIGRVAVKLESRKLKVGSKLFDYIERQASNNGIKTLKLGAQISAQGFYSKLGYIPYGDRFDDAGIPHIMMKKHIKKTD